MGRKWGKSRETGGNGSFGVAERKEIQNDPARAKKIKQKDDITPRERGSRDFVTLHPLPFPFYGILETILAGKWLGFFAVSHGFTMILGVYKVGEKIREKSGGR